MSRLDKAIFVLAAVLACIAYLAARYFLDARRGRLHRLRVGILGGLLLWALYATLAWRIISG